MKCFAGFPSWVTGISGRNQALYVEMMQGIFIIALLRSPSSGTSGFLEWWEEGCILNLCMCEWWKWVSLCHTSYWSRTPEIAMLKNTVVCALRSLTVIRHGTWLPVLPSESAGREGIRRNSKGTEQLQKQCFSVEKLKMNSKEGRLRIQEKSRVELLVLLMKG